MVASADAPKWRPGDTWLYRGRMFDSKDNRFYEQVVRETSDSGPPAYEVDTPDYVGIVDARTLRLFRRRNKQTGQVTSAVTVNPLWFPLNFSTRYSMSGTLHREGHEERPLSMACRVVNYENVEVHAGTFAAFRIDCETNDGFAEHWYAPAVKNLVKMRWMGKRDSFTAQLWDFELAK
jgi:hypothetical protein